MEGGKKSGKGEKGGRGEGGKGEGGMYTSQGEVPHFDFGEGKTEGTCFTLDLEKFLKFFGLREKNDALDFQMQGTM